MPVVIPPASACGRTACANARRTSSPDTWRDSRAPDNSGTLDHGEVRDDAVVCGIDLAQGGAAEGG
jgi:hypothetical protein